MKTLNKILDEQVIIIEQEAAEQGVTNVDFLNLLTDRCMKNWKVKKENENDNISIEKATALIFNLDLSVNKYQELRLELLTKIEHSTIFIFLRYV